MRLKRRDMLSKGLSFRLTEHHAVRVCPKGRSCRVAGRLAGVAGNGMGPACALARRAPVSTAPAPPPDETPVSHLQGEGEPGGPVLHRQGQEREPGAASDAAELHGAEDKVPQTLKSFVAETNQPLTLGILLDTSGSQQRVLPLEQQAGQPVLETGFAPKDEAFCGRST
jgi:hypothetical protein